MNFIFHFFLGHEGKFHEAYSTSTPSSPPHAIILSLENGKTESWLYMRMCVYIYIFIFLRKLIHIKREKAEICSLIH